MSGYLYLDLFVAVACDNALPAYLALVPRTYMDTIAVAIDVLVHQRHPNRGLADLIPTQC